MEIRRDYLSAEKISTIYFGGGTPSQLQVRDLERIICAIYRTFPVSDTPEVTIEANPDDLSDAYVSSLKTLPVNRISIGIQSFNDAELHLLNRRHTAREAVGAVSRCQDAGLTNISIDLMYGLPGQTTDTWIYNVERAVALDVPHLSAYSLTYEEGTAIHDQVESGKICPADDDLYEKFFHILTEKLATAGFVHYEISNFAKRSAAYPEGRISLHNSSYWNGTRYLGLGPAAHSYNGDCRSWNVSSITTYIKAIHEDSDHFYETEILDERTKYNDFIITRLRTMWGVSLSELRGAFGVERSRYFLEKSAPFLRLEMLKKRGDFVKVASDKFFVSDAIIRELIAL